MFQARNTEILKQKLPAPGQGEPTSFLFEAHTVLQNATAEGTGALFTEAVLNIEGDDIFSLKISDGEQTYTTEATTVDISNKKSVENFLQNIEESLAGSEIKASMDLDGNISFTRRDGGKIILQEFTSATGRKGTWAPSAGQGDEIFLEGNGLINPGTKTSYFSNTEDNKEYTSESYIPIEGATLTISNPALRRKLHLSQHWRQSTMLWIMLQQNDQISVPFRTG